MADRYGFDIGNAMLKGEQIKSARRANELADMKMKSFEEAGKKAGNINALKGKVLTGDSDALKSLIALDADVGREFMKVTSDMDQEKLKIAKQNIDKQGQMASFVLQGKTPQERQGRYNLVNKSKGIKEVIPFDKSTLLKDLHTAGLMDKHLDQLAKRKKLEGRLETDFKISSGDESLMSKAIHKALGGDVTGFGASKKIDDEKQRKKVRMLSAKATRFYKDARGSLTRREAVEKALESENISTPSDPKETPSSSPKTVSDWINKLK